MRTTSITCDRCGVGIGPNSRIDKYHIYLEAEDLDLCFTCCDELVEFMEAKKGKA